MLHCYIHGLTVANHSEINRQPSRLETNVTLTKQTPAIQINRQLFSTLRPTNHESQITNRVVGVPDAFAGHVRSNRHTPRLEITKKPIKSQFLAVLIVTFSRFQRAQFAHRGLTGSKGEKLPSRHKWTVAREQEIAQLIENNEANQFLFDTNEQASRRASFHGAFLHGSQVPSHQSRLSSAPTFVQDWGGESHDATILIITGGYLRLCDELGRCSASPCPETRRKRFLFQPFVHALGRTNRGGFSFGHRPFRRDLHFAFRHPGKARAAAAAGY
jgi:hypothetical protein